MGQITLPKHTLARLLIAVRSTAGGHKSAEADKDSDL